MEMFSSMHLFSTSGSMCFLWFGSTEATWRKAGVPWRSLSMPCSRMRAIADSIQIDFLFKPSCRGLPCGTFQLPPYTLCICNSHFPCPANFVVWVNYCSLSVDLKFKTENTAVTLNSVASFSFSSIETFECESLTFSCEDDGSAVAILDFGTLCNYYTVNKMPLSRDTFLRFFFGIGCTKSNG